jgi:hypothetical protein
VCGTAVYLINKETEHSIRSSDYYGPAILGLICAGAATYFYYKHINPPILCKFTKDGFGTDGGKLIPWTKIHNCEVYINKVVDQYNTTLYETIYFSILSPFGTTLSKLEIEAPNMPIEPLELEFLVKKYRDFFGKSL